MPTTRKSSTTVVVINYQNTITQSFSSREKSVICTTTATTIPINEVAPPISPSFPVTHIVDDTCRRGSVVPADYGTTSRNAADIGSTLIRFGTTAGDVSLTLGLRHPGNMPEKTSSFTVREFGGC